MSERKNGILVLNAGSSSLRFAVFTNATNEKGISLRLTGQISRIGAKAEFSASVLSSAQNLQETESLTEKGVDNHQGAIAFVLQWITQYCTDIELVGVGHRVVHGGPGRQQPARVTPGLLKELEDLSRLAPHHQPHNLAAIRAITTTKPNLVQIACFDTAFHASQSDTARSLPLPLSLRKQGLQKYGFHGLSYEFISSTIPYYNRGQMPEKLIVAHLGNGASLCAIENGRSIATSMGFSTLDGLLMGTRCGTIDPGVLLHLMREQNMDEAELSDLLYNRSGLLGVSGISADMQVLLSSDQKEARAAIELFCFTLRRAIGSMAAVLQGVDAIVFTGGIGENAAPVRQQVCEGLDWLGVKFNQKANQSGEHLLSEADSPTTVWAIPTDEELVIAQHTIKHISTHSQLS